MDKLFLVHFRTQFLSTKPARGKINPFQNLILSTGSRRYIDYSKFVRLGRLAHLAGLGRLTLSCFFWKFWKSLGKVLAQKSVSKHFLINVGIPGHKCPQSSRIREHDGNNFAQHSRNGSVELCFSKSRFFDISGIQSQHDSRMTIMNQQNV